MAVRELNFQALHRRKALNEEVGAAIQSLRMALDLVDRLYARAALVAHGAGDAAGGDRRLLELAAEFGRAGRASDFGGLARQNVAVNDAYVDAAAAAIRFASSLRDEMEEARRVVPQALAAAKAKDRAFFATLAAGQDARARKRLEAENFVLTMQQAMQHPDAPEHHILQAQISSNSVCLDFLGFALSVRDQLTEASESHRRGIAINSKAMSSALAAANAAAAAIEERLAGRTARKSGGRFVDEVRRSIDHERKIAAVLARLSTAVEKKLAGGEADDFEEIDFDLQSLIDERNERAKARATAAAAYVAAYVRAREG